MSRYTDAQEVEDPRRDVSFLARYFRLHREGHATESEVHRVAEIAERYPRFSEQADDNDAASMSEPDYPENMVWRTVPESDDDARVFAVIGNFPSGSDPLVGTMKTREVAVEAVGAHNARLRRVGRG